MFNVKDKVFNFRHAHLLSAFDHSGNGYCVPDLSMHTDSPRRIELIQCECGFTHQSFNARHRFPPLRFDSHTNHKKGKNWK